MTIIETNKHLIFSGNELIVEEEEVIKWYNDYDGPGVGIRNVDESNPNHKNHYREVLIPYTQSFSINRNNPITPQMTFDFWREVYGRELTAAEIGYEISLSMLGGQERNYRGENKVIYKEGDNPQNPDSWLVWSDDTKIKRRERKGDKDTYEMTPELLRIARKVVKDMDDDLEVINFYRDAFPENLNEKPNLYLVCDKEYLKKKFDELYGLMGLQLREDGKESIQIVDNWAAVQQIVAQDNADNSDETPTPTPPPAPDTPIPDNSAIQEYNQQMVEKFQEIYDGYVELTNQADEKKVILMSLKKEETPEITAQIDLICAGKQLVFGQKQELTGQGDESQKINQNRQVETTNTRLTQDYQNWLQTKKNALTKLTQLVEQIINPPAPQTPPGTPPSPNTPPKQNQNEPVNPIVENNQKSDENIKNISNTTSLNEAQQKAKQEINNLLDRYGVKSDHLNPTLWASQTNWETYLTALTTVEQVADLVKKMKLAIIQQNSQNNRGNQKLPLPQLKVKIINEIEDLLKKYPQIKRERLFKGENWKEKLNSLTSPQQIAALARQLREEIISQNNRQNQSPIGSSPNNFPVEIVILIVLVVMGILIAVIFLIRRWKIHLKQKRKVRK